MAKKASPVATFIITVNRDDCVGCGICESVCPDNWKVGKDGRTAFKNGEIGEDVLPKNKEAEETCPLHLISIMKK